MQFNPKPGKVERSGMSLTSGGSRAQLFHQGLTFLLSLPFLSILPFQCPLIVALFLYSLLQPLIPLHLFLPFQHPIHL